MQRLAADPSTTSLPRAESATTCPVCGDPVEGIEATRPGEHRFVGCDHYASGRFVRQRLEGVAADGPLIELGP